MKIIIEKINYLISSHSTWKMEVRNMIESEVTKADLSKLTSWRKSEFGMWLSAQKSNLGNQPEYKKVYQLHLAIHVEAARILTMALDGNRQEALEATSIGSHYSALSHQIIQTMKNWKQTLTQSAEAQPVLQWIG